MAKKPKRTKRTFKLLAKLKSVSFKVETASVGVSVTRKQLEEAGFEDPLRDLDALLTNAKLDAKVRFDPSSHGDVDGQGKLPATVNDEDGKPKPIEWSEEVEAIADVLGFSVRNKAVGFTMKFSIGDVDRATLSMMSDCSAEITLKRTGDSRKDKAAFGDNSKDAEDEDESDDGGLLDDE
ncbi:MAG: hypothetical protein KIPDCIKN_04352 [Haliscomenobacter sp.]|nr:hypothetical protein [Haliscomenobacter sp.]